jgi:Protein of unknown function (DUF3467)
VADENTPEQPDVNVMMNPADIGGVWANFARVSHSEHEFTIDFVRLDHTMSPVQGIVVARVNVSPLFVTQLIEALNSNWAKFAEKAMPKEVRGDDDDS